MLSCVYVCVCVYIYIYIMCIYMRSQSLERFNEGVIMQDSMRVPCLPLSFVKPMTLLMTSSPIPSFRGAMLVAALFSGTHRAFSASLLPCSFEHSNFSTFVWQLNTYGLKKVDPDRWEFANEGFVKGHKHLLKQMHWKKYQRHPRSLLNKALCTSNMMEKESTAQCEKVNAMKREKTFLLMEVIRLRQRQQETEEQEKAMLNRLHVVEHQQQHMVAFIARALHNPAFMAQLAHDSASLDSRKTRQFLPTSVQHVLDEADESQLCETLDLPTIPTSKHVQKPDEDEHGSYMLLEFLASDGEAEPANLEPLIQEMEHSTSTTNAYPVKSGLVGWLHHGALFEAAIETISPFSAGHGVVSFVFAGLSA